MHFLQTWILADLLCQKLNFFYPQFNHPSSSSTPRISPHTPFPHLFAVHTFLHPSFARRLFPRHLSVLLLLLPSLSRPPVASSSWPRPNLSPSKACKPPLTANAASSQSSPRRGGFPALGRRPPAPLPPGLLLGESEVGSCGRIDPSLRSVGGGGVCVCGPQLIRPPHLLPLHCQPTAGVATTVTQQLQHLC